MSYSGMHFEVLKIIALADVFSGFSVQKKEMLPGLSFKRSLQLGNWLNMLSQKSLNGWYAADMFKFFSFKEICWFYVLHLPKDIMLRILTFLGE